MGGHELWAMRHPQRARAFLDEVERRTRAGSPPKPGELPMLLRYGLGGAVRTIADPDSAKWAHVAGTRKIFETLAALRAERRE